MLDQFGCRKKSRDVLGCLFVCMVFHVDPIQNMNKISGMSAQFSSCV